MAERSPTQKKVHPDDDIESLSRPDLIARVKEQMQLIKQLEAKRMKSDKSDDDFESADRLKQFQKDAARRENTLVHRLTTKEQELQDYVNQIAELKHAQSQGTTQLKSMLLDPAVNIVFQRMAKELEEAQEKLKQTQNELSAWKFTPDSQTGKRLMARCQMLLQENEELGKTIASGKTAKLEGEIALQKTLVTEMKNNQSELDEFLGDLEEDVEGMQTMIYVLQQQLKESKTQLVALEEENARLRSGDISPSSCVKRQESSTEKVTKTQNINRNAYSCENDYAPMETRYYQEKTDSDLEAEYNYEGLYENEDKYQEELEQQQHQQQQQVSNTEQYDYDGNGYKNYEENYDSRDYGAYAGAEQEQMETDENEALGERTSQQHLDNRSNHLSPSRTVETDVTKSPVYQNSHQNNIKTSETTKQQLHNKHTDSQGNLTETHQDLHHVENGRSTDNCRKLEEIDREQSSENSRIPSPRSSKLSPKNKETATKSRNSVKTEPSPPKELSTNSNCSKQLTVDVKQHTDYSYEDSQSPSARSPGSLDVSKDQEQKVVNGVTSTVDDIEDL